MSPKDFEITLPGGGVLGSEAFMGATATDAMVILKDGAVVFEAYRRGMTARDPHILMSATKAVTGLLVGILQERGQIDVASPVVRILPEMGGTVYTNATLRDMIDMRVDVTFDAETQRAYDRATGWEPVADGSRQGLAAFFPALRGAAAPTGGPFRYVSANVDLLGLAIARATGCSAVELMEALLWKPMGAENPAYVTIDEDGAARMTGGLCAVARDFARIGQLLVDGGHRDGEDLVPAAWIDDIATQGDREAWRTGEWGQAFAPISSDMAYRSGWYVLDGAEPIMFAMGIHGQNLFVDRANRVVIAKLSSQADATDFNAIGLTHIAIPQIMRHLRR